MSEKRAIFNLCMDALCLAATAFLSFRESSPLCGALAGFFFACILYKSVPDLYEACTGGRL